MTLYNTIFAVNVALFVGLGFIATQHGLHVHEITAEQAQTKLMYGLHQSKEPPNTSPALITTQPYDPRLNRQR